MECGRWLGGASTGLLGQNWFKIVFYVIRRKITCDGLLMNIVSKLLLRKCEIDVFIDSKQNYLGLIEITIRVKLVTVHGS